MEALQKRHSYAAREGCSWGTGSQRMIWNLPDKQGKFGMVWAEGTACPKVGRYAGKFIFGELRIVWHDMVIILENGKRRAGKVHRSEITKGLVIQARSLEIILGALGKN